MQINSTKLVSKQYIRTYVLPSQKRMPHLNDELIVNKSLEMFSKRDNFKGLRYDLTALNSTHVPKLYSDKGKIRQFNSSLFKRVLLKKISAERLNGIHVIGLKIASHDSDIMKAAMECGFRHHNANPEHSLLNLCLMGHDVKKCSFPSFKTLSAGVTGVVFDASLKHVLVIKEKIGDSKKVKPPTGSIDYEKGDTPKSTVIKEIKEETGIDIDPSQVKLVAAGWTKDYREGQPDISYIFATVVSEMQKPQAQESEIAFADWGNVEDFVKAAAEEGDKPWVMTQAVVQALAAVKSNGGWDSKQVYLSNGKPVIEFYSRE